MSIPSRFASSVEAKKAGWFSRRHQTRDAHVAAQDAYRTKRDEKHTREQEQRERTAKRRSA